MSCTLISFLRSLAKSSAACISAAHRVSTAGGRGGRGEGDGGSVTRGGEARDSARGVRARAPRRRAEGRAGAVSRASTRRDTHVRAPSRGSRAPPPPPGPRARRPRRPPRRAWPRQRLSSDATRHPPRRCPPPRSSSPERRACGLASREASSPNDSAGERRALRQTSVARRCDARVRAVRRAGAQKATPRGDVMFLTTRRSAVEKLRHRTWVSIQVTPGEQSKIGRVVST